jgi:hypothetical protein
MHSATSQKWPLLTSDGEMVSGSEDAVFAAAPEKSVQAGDGYQYVDNVKLKTSQVAAMDLPEMTRWWHEHMRLPAPAGSAVHIRALNLLIHACCRWQSNQRPRMLFVAALLACLAAEEPRPVLPVIGVRSVTEVLLLAQWQVLGLTVAHQWKRDTDVIFVVLDASQGVALQAVLPQLEGAERGADPVQWASRLSRLAVVSEALSNVASAIQYYQRELEATEASLSPRHSDVATSLNNLAEMLRAQGDYASARPLYERALAIREAWFGPRRHPDVVTSLNNLAELLRAQGEYIYKKVRQYI